MSDLTFKLITTIGFLILLSCQDTQLETELQADNDMEEAWALANDYISTSRSDVTDVDVTVIRYSSNLQYKTNTVTGEYDPIAETTITAHSRRGGYVFWLAGNGVQRLISIEMSEDSQEELGEDNPPFSVVDGLYWALWIPHDLDDDIEQLKYDIVYESDSGEIIRLDPKLQLHANN